MSDAVLFEPRSRLDTFNTAVLRIEDNCRLLHMAPTFGLNTRSARSSLHLPLDWKVKMYA